MVQLAEEEKEGNVVTFVPKLITGGKGPPTGIGDSWLDKLEVGTAFFVKNQRDPLEFALGLFCLKGRQGKVTVLLSPEVPGKDIYVDAGAFCTKYRNFETLGQFYDPSEGEEGGEDECDRVQGNDGESSDELERSLGEQEKLPDVPVRDDRPGTEHR